MFDEIKDKFSRIKFPARIKRKNIREDEADKNENENESLGYGKIYSLWLLIVPLLLGSALGKLTSVGLGYGFEFLAGNSGVMDRAVTGATSILEAEDTKRGLDVFLTSNPFHISPQKPASLPTPSTPSQDIKPEEPDTGLDDLILRGTLPGVGAWIENKGKTDLLLVGKNVDRYKLTSVKYSEAVFRRGKKSITKYITYGPVAAKTTPAPTKAPAAANNPPVQSTGNIIAATTTGQEGEVSSETVNQLVQNPFDELKRIRIRPNDKAGGLEVQWIQNDSILKRLGVQKGDVIKSVNGIPFTNMGDIANSINSLMNSERFDVEVTRNGKSEALRYVVR